jgi:hypothetical protein
MMHVYISILVYQIFSLTIFIDNLSLIGSGNFVVSVLNNSEHEKIVLEHHAAKMFMRWNEHETDNPIRHLWHNRTALTDVTCRFEGDRLDLEIAHIYVSQQEAMPILKRLLGNNTRQE